MTNTHDRVPTFCAYRFVCDFLVEFVTIRATLFVGVIGTGQIDTIHEGSSIVTTYPNFL